MDNDDFEKFLKQLGFDTSKLSKEPGPITRAMQNVPPPGIEPDWWEEQQKAAALEERTRQMKERSQASIDELKRKLEILQQRALQKSGQERFDSLPRGFKPVETPKPYVPPGPSITEVATKFVVKHRDDLLVGLVLAITLGVAVHYLL